MNLGDIYLRAFFVILALSLIAATGIAWLVKFIGRKAIRSVLALSLGLWLIISYFALPAWHHRLFTAWHKLQNTALPQDRCLTYEPDFANLYATYQMSRLEVEAWIANHSWHLAPGEGMVQYDGEKLGFDHPELIYETEPAPNGKQLRLYYKSGIMYVSYNSM